MLQAAPFMAHPLPIIIPIYTWWEIPYMWAGAKAYDLVAGSRRAVPESYYINKDEALFQFPMLKPDGLKGACVCVCACSCWTRRGQQGSSRRVLNPSPPRALHHPTLQAPWCTTTASRTTRA
jgi:hypothetical protein